MSATVGVSPVSRPGQLADQRARTSVSERFDAVNTSGQRRPVRRVVMVSLAVHRRRCSDRVRRNKHQWLASTWSERWDGVNGRSHWLERLKTTRRRRSPAFHRRRRNDRAGHDGQFSRVHLIRPVLYVWSVQVSQPFNGWSLSQRHDSISSAYARQRQQAGS